MDIVSALGLVAPMVVRRAGMAAEERLTDLAEQLAGQLASVRSAGARVEGTAQTTWESAAAELFREGIRRQAARSHAAEEAMRRAESRVRRAGVEIRHRLEQISHELAGWEEKMVQTAGRVASEAETRSREAAGTAAFGSAALLDSDAVRQLRSAYENTVESSLVRNALAAVAAGNHGCAQ
ncbi:hypothetical protein [Rothia uropygioeca]|uniref:hypothetical protein n=1 Tax=Kocuria sp. 257 TaxID=2021970 RepID=UPI0010126C3D|nr:hypothetical protein [Kocuria sp. 257]